MGEVFLAEDTLLHRKVALKCVLGGVFEGSEARKRTLREARQAGRINDPRVAAIHDVLEWRGGVALVMEYVEGQTVRHEMAGPVSPETFWTVALHCLEGVAAAHREGVIHRDLKPGNIRVRGDGSLALIDFGLAKRMRLEQEITSHGEIFGTPYYMSPEQGHADEVDERSDVYSLGVIFYEMLTGEKPYLGADAMSIILKHAKAPVPVLPHHLAQYQVLINLMLAKRPADRIQNAREIPEWL